MADTATKMSPSDWPITVSAGDGLVPTEFSVTERNERDIQVQQASAQVRRERSRDASEVMELTVDVTDNVVTIGAWEEIPYDPGDWWWDLQVSGTLDDAPFGPLTIVGGVFSILTDVTHESGS